MAVSNIKATGGAVLSAAASPTLELGKATLKRTEQQGKALWSRTKKVTKVVGLKTADTKAAVGEGSQARAKRSSLRKSMSALSKAVGLRTKSSAAFERARSAEG